MGLLARAKNAAIEQAVSKLLRSRIERYGDLRQFNVDVTERRFSAEILLHGETVPVRVSEGRYRVEDRRGEPYVVLFGIRVSREWAQNALDDHFPELAIKVPEFARSLL